MVSTMTDMTNAQVAVMAAAQIHQKAAAGAGGAGQGYSTGQNTEYRSSDTAVLGTATALLRFLKENS
jgi:hypothetical protein